MSREEIIGRAIDEVVSQMSNDEKDIVKEVARKIRTRYDVDTIRKKAIREGDGKIQSFLDPVIKEENRTTKSVPRRGFTSISRIAKG